MSFPALSISLDLASSPLLLLEPDLLGPQS